MNLKNHPVENVKLKMQMSNKVRLNKPREGAHTRHGNPPLQAQEAVKSSVIVNQLQRLPAMASHTVKQMI